MDPLALVKAFGVAWEEHDLDKALSYLSDDCLFEATDPAPDGTRHVGVSAIRQAWTAIFEDPSSVFEVEEAFSSGDRVTQRWRYSWGDGYIRGVDVFKVRGDRISEKLSYVKG